MKRIMFMVAAGVIGLMIAYSGYVYASSPETIRAPKMEHYHFRMQVLVNGKAEDFGSQAYQTGYAKDQCNANLPEQPIHFHDNKDQFTHIHWEGMTGGMVMKYYGWNYIGGIDRALGYKLDNLKDIQKVTTHGDYLPQLPEDAILYIYTGHEGIFTKRSLEEWRDLDLEQFFGTTSNFPAHQQNKQAWLLDKLFPTASAHNDPGDADGDGSGTAIDPAAPKTQEELTRINNLIGNVVIFAQKDEPTAEQVLERFKKLEPLTDSTCGG